MTFPLSAWSSWQASVEEKHRNIFASIAYSEDNIDQEMLHELDVKTTCSMLDTTLLFGEFARPTDIEDISRSTDTILRQLPQVLISIALGFWEHLFNNGVPDRFPPRKHFI